MLGTWKTLGTWWVSGDMEDSGDPESVAGLWRHRRPWGHGGTLETRGYSGMVGTRWNSGDTVAL